MGSALATIGEDVNWRAGEDRTFRFYVYELIDPAQEDRPDNRQVPAGIATWTFMWYLSERQGQNTAVLSIPGSLTNAVAGAVDVPILESDTEDLRIGRYFHALWRENTGSHWELAAGPAFLSHTAGRP